MYNIYVKCWCEFYYITNLILRIMKKTVPEFIKILAILNIAPPPVGPIQKAINDLFCVK